MTDIQFSPLGQIFFWLGLFSSGFVLVLVAVIVWSTIRDAFADFQRGMFMRRTAQVVDRAHDTDRRRGVQEMEQRAYVAQCTSKVWAEAEAIARREIVDWSVIPEWER